MVDQTPKRSWFSQAWPPVLAASGVGYVTTAYAVTCWLTRRSPAKLETPAGFGPVEKLVCRTADGIKLKGWHIAPRRPRGVVALFHGMRHNRSYMLERIAFLIQAGFRCVAFDHRAHGESGGRVTSFGYHEQNDVAAVLGVIRQRWPDEPCAALGTSMGAAALCFSREIARGFDALILESVYSDLERAFDQRVGRGYPDWFQHFRRGIEWFTERRLKLRICQVSPLAHIPHLAPCPILLMTGTDDPHAPPEEVALLAAQVPDSSRFHTIPGAGHNSVCTIGGPLYRNLILGFLDEHIGFRHIAVAA